MKSRLHVIWMTVALYTLSAPIGAQQPQLSPSDVENIKKEVTAAVNKYYQVFSNLDLQALQEDVYNIPWISVGAQGVSADVTKEQFRTRFDAILKRFRDGGWGKSLFLTDSVCVLNANMAIVSGRHTPYKTDGTPMPVGGVSYVFAKGVNDWKIITFASHPAEKVVSCE